MTRHLFCCGLLALAVSGCAGYRLGPTNGLRPGARSVQVNPFANQTLEPRLSDTVTAAIRKQLQQDGTYQLDTRNRGDIVVSGTLVRYDRDGLSYRPTDVITPRDYRVEITARVTATERATGRVLFDRKVEGRTTVQIGTDLPSAERQAGPLLAEDLARSITALLVDGEW